MSRRVFRRGASLLLGWGLFLLAGSARADDAPREFVLGDCLVLPPVGVSGRSAVHRDAVEAEIVAGRWKAPRAGDKVTLPDGRDRAWEAARAKDGALDHTALRGGYLYWKVEADADRVMLLEAAGHSMVYVNGEPRAGDPYQYGFVRLPVALHAGANDLLFAVGRGQLSARLTTPPRPVFLDLRDATVSDVVKGEVAVYKAAVVVVNASTRPLAGLAFNTAAGDTKIVVKDRSLTIPPLAIRKIPFSIPGAPADATDKYTVEVTLSSADGPRVLDSAKLEVRVRRPDQSYRRTFYSDIDNSLQYYAVQPARPDPKDKDRPALFLTLHGAGVEGLGQADAYRGKTWGHIVAPTNRRPYGFDWEDWGRLDALEVLELAQKQLKTDPRRVYLTGQMGGHGVWHLGATYPDRFAAIAPSAAWISFWTYAGGRRPDKPTPIEAMLLRASSPSETFALARNYAQHGVYVLHGDADDNVPVEQARRMRQVLGEFHPDFAYYERPGAGHWWGNECVDWPPLFEFLGRHSLPRVADVRRVEFVTASPGVSARCRWAVVEAQVHPLQPSTIKITCDPKDRRFRGETDNVARLALDLDALTPGDPLTVELDGQRLDKFPWPDKGRLWLKRTGDKWAASAEPAKSLKGPDRYGPFKEAFRNHMVFVYGTKGTKEENAWAYDKARFDAETFWYRGNGSVDVVADADFDADKQRDRNVILYGHAESNAAWKALLGDGPVQVRRGAVVVGDRKEKGDDLACLFVRPRPGSDSALVGAVSGTGPAGLRLTDRLAYFVSGSGFPDCLVLGPEMLAKGAEGVRAAGFFGEDWGVASGDFVWGKDP
jgi:dienelactone hydrolase